MVRLSTSGRWAVLFAAIALAVFSFFAFSPSIAQAHRSGCHRWHSCPSDTGSYVCGDIGHSNYCGGTVVQPTPRPTQPPTLSPTAVPAYTAPSSSTSAPSAPPLQRPQRAGRVSADLLNVRSGPSTDYPVIGGFTRDIRIMIHESSNGWLRTDYQDRSDAWVYSEFVAEDTSGTSGAAPESVNDGSYSQPILINPVGGDSRHDPLRFEWDWTGTLAEGHGFDVQVWQEGESPAGITHPSYVLKAGEMRYIVDVSSLPHPKGNRYQWRVRIVQVESGQNVGPVSESNTFRYD